MSATGALGCHSGASRRRGVPNESRERSVRCGRASQSNVRAPRDDRERAEGNRRVLVRDLEDRVTRDDVQHLVGIRVRVTGERLANENELRRGRDRASNLALDERRLILEHLFGEIVSESTFRAPTGPRGSD